MLFHKKYVKFVGKLLYRLDHKEEGEDFIWSEFIGQMEDGRYTLLTQHQEPVWDEGYIKLKDLMMLHGIKESELIPLETPGN